MGSPNTRKNIARKARINEKQRRTVLRQISKIEAMTADHKAAIKKLLVASARGEVVTANSLPNWRELREMGAVREKDGALALTAVGHEIASEK
ncbi:MAG: hypothetical protein KF716_29735 [Anaerolineae bacterium]|nr:hypothetical protein [Anaerolineae bacterium]